MLIYASGTTGVPKDITYSTSREAWFLLRGLAVLDDQQGDLDAEALRIYAPGVTGKPKDIIYSDTRLMHGPSSWPGSAR